MLCYYFFYESIKGDLLAAKFLACQKKAKVLRMDWLSHIWIFFKREDKRLGKKADAFSA